VDESYYKWRDEWFLDIQREIGEWQKREFRPDGSPPHTLIDVLIIVEETGEVCRCYVKRDQNIRGGAEHWTRELRIELGDVIITVLAFAANHQLDLMDGLSALGGSTWDNPFTHAVSEVAALELSHSVGELSDVVTDYSLDNTLNERQSLNLAKYCAKIIYATMSIADAEGFGWHTILQDRWSEVKERKWKSSDQS
jgi:NTP pyrophosphatase (non-canonical NTP hydrolase)